MSRNDNSFHAKKFWEALIAGIFPENKFRGVN